jgi:ATP-dependent exoDNAse (exonuclease V) alpha subunit
MKHLAVRVAWHDARWNGTVCPAASKNSYCLDLDRIRIERDDAYEDGIASQHFADLPIHKLPPCRAESGTFMSGREIVQIREHPYQGIPKARATHGNLKPTPVKVPAYSTLVTPFWWMLRNNQQQIDDHSAQPLPPDAKPPFPSPWVFGAERQEALSRRFFDQLSLGESLMFLYTKSGHPLGDEINRLVVALGTVTGVAELQRYDTDGGTGYPLWDRVVSHSIRPDKSDGFLLPYHDYLEPTGDDEEDVRRLALLQEVAVVPDPSHLGSFSYAGELAGSDVALSTLVRALEAVRAVRRHGIVPGPWDQREEWINTKIGEVWQQRGAFPGAGGMLEALGCRLGTSLVMELLSSGRLGMLEDPWPLLDAIILSREEAPTPYRADLNALAGTYGGLDDERRALLRLLSRFDLTSGQAKRWWDHSQRGKSSRRSITDAEILENAYRIAELDLGSASDWPVTVGVIDRGLLPDSTVAAACPVEGAAAVTSPNDPRRARAALVTVLRRAAEDGDALLTAADAIERVSRLDLERPVAVDADWLHGNSEELDGEIDQVTLTIDAERGVEVSCLQLSELGDREARLRSLLSKRASRAVASLGEDWESLLRIELEQHDEDNPRHLRALQEKSVALEMITTRRLSALVGRAGTGKTKVLGALLRSDKLRQDGILFLAPTGKARVRIAKVAPDAQAMTVAQFLYRLDRYDGARQRALFEGKEQYRTERTVVIDECSMLTMDDLLAVLLALDLGHVERLIMVGDPNQLPPIGVGRPFADLVAKLDSADEGDPMRGALARLTVEMRSGTDTPSDTLRLASWYTRELQPVDADRVLSDLELGSTFNDLEIRFWRTPTELRDVLDKLFVSALGLSAPDDVSGFNASLGLTPEGWVPWDDHSGAENWQLLSPVRAHPHGVHDLNRWVQQRFRAEQLSYGRKPWGVALGDEEIVSGDKVILTRNVKRRGFQQGRVEEYLANGEVGLMNFKKNESFLNACFTGRDGQLYAFSRGDFPSGGGGPLELAYALTVHKAQGSDFGTTMVVLPRQSRLMSRELLYTALTRSRNRLVLLIEGTDASFLYDLTRPERSETARRNTNLFAPGVRDDRDAIPYAEHLVHRTSRGELVRSKSELVIANYLHSVGLPYFYERELRGTVDDSRLRPDFSFVDDAGDVIVWEHLGMLDRPDYQAGWNWKRAWYERNGFALDSSLFTTSELGGLDMREVEATARKVQDRLR